MARFDLVYQRVWQERGQESPHQPANVTRKPKRPQCCLACRKEFPSSVAFRKHICARGGTTVGYTVNEIATAVGLTPSAIRAYSDRLVKLPGKWRGHRNAQIFTKASSERLISFLRMKRS